MFELNIKLKLICIFCLISTLLSILMAYFNPASGYELSLYEYTPSIVWIGLVSSILGGVSIIVYVLYRNLFKYYYFCFLGLFILLFDRVVLLYIPYIRGYYSWRGDNISHIGILKDILIFGHTASDNVYPITHILLSELVYITGLPITIVANYSTALFSIFYVMSIYLLATSTLVTKREQILAVTSISCVFFNGYDVYLMPNGWSILYLPFVLFLYFKSLVKNHSLEYTILFAIMLIMYPFFHPLSAFTLILMLVTIGFVKYLTYIIKNRSFSLINKSFFSLTSIGLETVIFLFWILSLQRFNPSIKQMYHSITTGSSPNVIASMSSSINKLSLTAPELIEISIKMMGQQLIFLILSFFSFLLLLKYPNARKGNRHLITLLSITSVFGIIYAFYLFNVVPGLQNIGSDRFLAYLVIFTPVCAGFVLSYIISKKITIHLVNFSPIICVIIILIASIISILNLYPSPYVMQPSPSITEMDIKGAEWFLNFKNTDINSVYISPVFRFADGILGYTESKKLLGGRYLATILPDHLNYTISNNLGSSYTQDKYCVITTFDKEVYDTVWKTIGRFNKRDFEMLEQDSTVDKLYSNGECIICYIHKI